MIPPPCAMAHGGLSYTIRNAALHGVRTCRILRVHRSAESEMTSFMSLKGVPTHQQDMNLHAFPNPQDAGTTRRRA